MLDRRRIHNSAVLEPQLTKNARNKKPVDDTLKEKGKKDNGLRQRQLHNSKRSSDIS